MENIIIGNSQGDPPRSVFNRQFCKGYKHAPAVNIFNGVGLGIREKLLVMTEIAFIVGRIDQLFAAADEQIKMLTVGIAGL